MNITLTDEQSNAVTQITQHFRSNKQQCFSLGGYAGTGKTTVIKAVIEALSKPYPCKACEGAGEYSIESTTREPGDVETCPTCGGEGTIENEETVMCTAFTGKAVSVLRKKGLYSSQTLHSLMYHCEKDSKGKLIFTKRSSIEPDFIIVDEASMLNTSLYNDLLSFRKPVLFVGDPGQLPPVGDNPNVMSSPQIILSKIHRQAELNPIIRFATDLRAGRMWGVGQHMLDGVVALDIRGKDSPMTALLEVDQVITAYNKKRLEINRMIREHLGFKTPLVLGEKVICLKNDRPKNLFNGLILKVTRIYDVNDPQRFICDLEDEAGNTWSEIPIFKRGLNGGFDEKKEILPSGTCLFDYGYCITCHKSQGSEWDSVLVLEQWAHPKLWEMPRWQYTAATRAAKKLIYVR